MPRQLTADQNDEISWDETVRDPDGDDVTHTLTGKVELDKVDGTPQTGTDRTPAWLSATVQENGLVGGEWEEVVTTTVDTTQIPSASTLTFKYEATDSVASTALLRQLTIQ